MKFATLKVTNLNTLKGIVENYKNDNISILQNAQQHNFVIFENCLPYVG